MTHFYVFCYIAALLTGVAALTIQMLSDRCNAGRNSLIMNLFIIVVLLVDFYDFLIYYNDHIMYVDEGRLIISFGGCLLAVLTSLWIGITAAGLEGRKYWLIHRSYQIYVLVYIGAWFLLVFLFPTYRWSRLILDLPLMLGLFLVSGYLVLQGRKYETKKVTVYKVLITLLWSLDAVTYFLRETGFYPKKVMDMTIIYLLLINVVNIALLYLLDFSTAGRHDQTDKEIAWHQITEDYRLTEREVEVLKKVYDGETNLEIADEFFISERTVKAHIHNIFKKLKVKNRMEALCLVRTTMEKEKSECLE
ncbi:helix-turn-helix domain-containing protein [Emergencia sp.]|uniref:helix-turn-helix domain-containing protein n=1 Tax=Emergencia sp. TaxID=1926557 RepID=UPI003AF032DE